MLLVTAVLFACGRPEPARSAADAPGGDAAAGGAGASSEGGLSPAAQAVFDEGRAAFDAGDLSTAQARFERAIALDASAAAAHTALGAIAEHEGHFDAALKAYDGALEAKPGYGPAILAKTRLELEQGRPADAEAFAQAQRAKFADSPAALTAHAEVLSVRGNSADAQKLGQQALKLEPDYRPAMVMMARDHFRAHRVELSLFALGAILDGVGPENPARDKDNVEARLLRALIYKGQGKRQPAMADFERVVALRADLVPPRLALATYLLEAGNADRARPLLEQALRFEASNVHLHLLLGDTYRLLGMPKDALEHLEWVARRDAKLPQVHYNLGLVYLFSPQVPGLTEMQAAERAIAEFERYKELVSGGSRAAASDIEELLGRAKSKKSILELSAEEPAKENGG